MPVKNGYEAAREIRNSGMERINELPILAMTADAFAEDIKSARLAGMNGHLAKPISMEQLKKALANCFIWKKKNQWEIRRKPIDPETRFSTTGIRKTRRSGQQKA